MSQGPLKAAIALFNGSVLRNLNLQGDAQGALVGANRHGTNYESALAGTVVMGANQAGVTTSAGLATTYVGICLSNPAASGKNLSLLRATAALIVAPAALTGIGLITGFAAGGITAHTTPLTPQSSIVGGSATLVGKLDSACTLVGTPAWSRWFGVTPGATSVVSFDEDMQGSIIIPPGGYAAIGTTIAGPASGFLGSLTWEENPV